MTGYDFKTAYKSDASGSYIVIEINGNSENIIRYQAEIVSNNQIHGILPFKLVQKNELIQLKYDITSLLRFKDFISKSNIANEIPHILSGICNAVLESEGFLLDENCFVLQQEFIYINPASLEVYLVYIPIKRTDDISRSFKELISDIINETLECKQYKSQNYFKTITGFLQHDGFTILKFKELLQNVSNTTNIKEEPYHLDVSLYTTLESNKPANNVKKNIELDNNIFYNFFKHVFKIIPKREGNNNSTYDKPNIVDSTTIADTVPLSQQEIYQPFLLFGNGENKVKIKVISDNFMLGRLIQKVDYVIDSKAVGKVHACIRSRHGRYYIVDLNSKNGTFINGTRIESNIEYEMKDKDEISLANIEFTFLFPSS